MIFRGTSLKETASFYFNKQILMSLPADRQAGRVHDAEPTKIANQAPAYRQAGFFGRIILMEKKLLLTVFLSIILLLIFIIILFSSHSKNQSRVCFRDNCFTVELAITTQERTRGLMFREKLDLDKGMLFIFENEGEYPFWMKNTFIHLDIIWINKDKEVVFISKNTQPCESDSCPTVNPDKKAQYVLELNGGIADKIGLDVGDKIIFDTEF